MKDKVAAKHVFVFNQEDNGGESLTLITKFIDNGDSEYYAVQELTLNSYCNSATFNLQGAALNPDNLRKLANELEIEKNRIPYPVADVRDDNA